MQLETSRIPQMREGMGLMHRAALGRALQASHRIAAEALDFALLATSRYWGLQIANEFVR